MDRAKINEQLMRAGGIVRLEPAHVGRFYTDGNRMGQQSPRASKPSYYRPERWIVSSTLAANPPGIPSGGISRCATLGTRGARPTLRELLADTELGPRLLGARRYTAHDGAFRVLIKILDAFEPIPFHVHADDAFVTRNPGVYPSENFGKDEAYHFLDAPKGFSPYTHIGLHPGVTVKQLIAAMRRGVDHLLELSPAGYQNYGEGFHVNAGMLHRPGSALTLEVQQPSDVYTFFQTEFCGRKQPENVLHPGFSSLEEAAENVIRWDANRVKGVLDRIRLMPVKVPGMSRGGRAEWIFPPTMSRKFSGMRVSVDATMKLRFDEPFAVFVWSGRGTLGGHACNGARGWLGARDEFFVGAEAASRGVDVRNDGDSPLVMFVIFAARL